MIILHVGLLLMSMELTAAISHEDAWDAFMVTDLLSSDCLKRRKAQFMIIHL